MELPDFLQGLLHHGSGVLIESQGSFGHAGCGKRHHIHLGGGPCHLAAIQLHLDRRAGGAFRVGAVLFSNQHGPLGQTETVVRLLDEWKE